MTTNQDGPNTAGAAELKACPLCASGQVTTAPDHEFGDTTWAVICKACWCRVERDLEVDAIAAWNRRAENPTPRPSAVPDEVVEAILFHVEHVCGPLNTEPCVILGDDDRSVLASAIRAALIAERDRLAERCERLEEALLTIKHEAERENGRWVHMKRCIAVQTKAALKEPRP